MERRPLLARVKGVGENRHISPDLRFFSFALSPWISHSLSLYLSLSISLCLSLAREATPEIEKRTFVSFVVRFSLALLRGRLSSHSVMSACLAALPAFVSCTLCRRRRIDDWDIVRGNHRGQATEEIGIEKRGKGKDEVLLVDTQIRECPPLPSMVPTTVLWAVTFLAIAYGVLALPSRSSWFLCLEWLSTFRRLLNWLPASRHTSRCSRTALASAFVTVVWHDACLTLTESAP